MGKSKQKRFKAKQANPTGLPSVKEFETELESTATSIPSIQPIIEQVNMLLYAYYLKVI